jgi:hypothetical protein
MLEVETRPHPENVYPLEPARGRGGSRILRNYDRALSWVQHRTGALFDPGRRVSVRAFQAIHRLSGSFFPPRQTAPAGF